MNNFTIHDTGWISVEVPAIFEQEARDIRAERDKRYGNIFTETDTDVRWVGDLGEIVFNYWIRNNNSQDVTWIRENAAGQPDFLISQNRIGVKTVKRQVAPRNDYTAQITARHAREPIDQFFFMTYQITNRNIWLLGGIDRDRFLRESRYYAAGEQVHANYIIREGHEIYNIGIDRLIAPVRWLESINLAY